MRHLVALFLNLARIISSDQLFELYSMLTLENTTGFEMSPKMIHRSVTARNPTMMKMKSPTNLMPMGPDIITPTEQSHHHHEAEKGLQNQKFISTLIQLIFSKLFLELSNLLLYLLALVRNVQIFGNIYEAITKL